MPNERMPTLKRTQIRGRKRREQLIDTARQLLCEREIQLISLPDVANRAGIPPASAYHFFSDVQDLMKSVAGVVEQELFVWQEQVKETPMGDCRQILEAYIRRGAQFFRANQDACQLLLGPYTPPIIKLTDREGIRLLANQLHLMVTDRFNIPHIDDPETKFYNMLEVADLFFSLSVFRHKEITPEYEDEAVLAGISYMSAYIPWTALTKELAAD